MLIADLVDKRSSSLRGLIRRSWKAVEATEDWLRQDDPYDIIGISIWVAGSRTDSLVFGRISCSGKPAPAGLWSQLTERDPGLAGVLSFLSGLGRTDSFELSS